MDAAACGAEEKDQIDDILQLVYKLRHTDNASDFLPSTEYAVLRLLLKHDQISDLFKILNDPLNYGVFLNEHIACLAINRFIDNKEYSSAARIATIVMQQEMFDSQLLNKLSIFSLIKFVELPTEERKMGPELLAVSEPFEEDDESPTFRYPYLKNNWNDGHFDINDSDLLVSKSLEWFSKVVEYKDPKMKESLELISYAIGKKYEKLEEFLKRDTLNSIKESALNIVRTICKETLQSLGEEDVDVKKKDILTGLISKIGDGVSEGDLLSDELMNDFKVIQKEEETKLSSMQKDYYNAWNKRREELLKSQAERLKLQLRLEEISTSRKELSYEKELLFFFENRTKWELKAAEKTKLLEEMKASS